MSAETGEPTADFEQYGTQPARSRGKHLANDDQLRQAQGAKSGNESAASIDSSKDWRTCFEGSIRRPDAVHPALSTACGNPEDGHDRPGPLAVQDLTLSVPAASQQDAGRNRDCSSSSASSIDSVKFERETFVDSSGKLQVIVSSAETYADRIATKAQLDATQATYPLPDARSSESRSILNWSIFRHVTMSFYRRFMTVVLVVNVAVFGVMVRRSYFHSNAFTYADAATATGANLVAAVLMRHEHCINLLFRLALSFPSTSPLAIRRCAAKIAYTYGGIHAGAGHSALLWYILYTFLLIGRFDGSRDEYVAVVTLTVVTLLLFATIIGLAHPKVRQRRHDLFELGHRYCGYMAILCVWAQTIICAVAACKTPLNNHSLAFELVITPVFWFLIIISFCIIHPYLWLRRLPVEAHQLSGHATELRFHNRNVECCAATRLSRNPLTQNHGFATIAHPRPTNGADPEKGYSVLISNAGDWTKEMISSPPARIWQKGAPTMGVMRLAELFRPIVIVATGSGIGPVCSFLNKYPHHPKRVLWSARSPEQTYQSGLIRNVLSADPDAVIIDTKQTGTPDLLALTYAMVKEISAEAVMIISNPKTTRQVVYCMESRGIAAFGAIFDS